MPKQSRQRNRKIFLPPRNDALTFQQYRMEQQAARRQKVVAPKVEMVPELAQAMDEMRKQMTAQMKYHVDANPLFKLIEEMAEREKLREALTKPPKPPRPPPRRYLLLLPPRK